VSARDDRGGGQVLRDGFLLFYCASVGFVASGVAASFFKMVTHEPARFALLGKGWLATAVTFLFCAIGMALVGLCVAVFWSICSGMLVLDLVLQLKESLA
jgi:hypothetical protein